MVSLHYTEHNMRIGHYPLYGSNVAADNKHCVVYDSEAQKHMYEYSYFSGEHIHTFEENV